MSASSHTVKHLIHLLKTGVPNYCWETNKHAEPKNYTTQELINIRIDNIILNKKFAYRCIRTTKCSLIVMFLACGWVIPFFFLLRITCSHEVALAWVSKIPQLYMTNRTAAHLHQQYVIKAQKHLHLLDITWCAVWHVELKSEFMMAFNSLAFKCLRWELLKVKCCKIVSLVYVVTALSAQPLRYD